MRDYHEEVMRQYPELASGIPEAAEMDQMISDLAKAREENERLREAAGRVMTWRTRHEGEWEKVKHRCTCKRCQDWRELEQALAGKEDE